MAQVNSFSIDNNMKEALLEWVRLFKNNDGVILWSDLHDGEFLNEIMHEIDSSHDLANHKTSLPPTPHISTPFFNEMINWTYLVDSIFSFYQDTLLYLNFIKPPNVFKICSNPKSDDSLREVEKAVLMLLGCAVQCSNKKKFVEQIKTLNSSVHPSLVKCIKEVTDHAKNFIHTSQVSMEKLPILFENVKNVTRERKDLMIEVGELSEKLKALNSSAGECEKCKKSSEDDSIKTQLMEVQQIKIKELQHQLDEKLEEISDLNDDLDRSRKKIISLEQQNLALTQEASTARSYRDELDVANEKASKLPHLERKYSKLQKKLSDLDYWKQQSNLLSEENEKLSQTKDQLENEVIMLRKKCESLKFLEAEVERFEKEMNDICESRKFDKETIKELCEEKTKLELENKSLLSTFTRRSFMSESFEFSECQNLSLFDQLMRSNNPDSDVSTEFDKNQKLDASHASINEADISSEVENGFGFVEKIRDPCEDSLNILQHSRVKSESYSNTEKLISFDDDDDDVDSKNVADAKGHETHVDENVNNSNNIANGKLTKPDDIVATSRKGSMAKEERVKEEGRKSKIDEEELTQTRESVEKLIIEIKKLKDFIKLKDAAIMLLKMKVDEKSKECGNLLKEIEEKKNLHLLEINQLKEKIALMDSSTEALKSENRALKARLAKSQEKIERLEDVKEKLHADMNSKNTKITELFIENNKIAAQQEATVRVCDKVEEENVKLLDQLRDTLSQNQDLLVMILTSRDHHAEEQKSYIERLSDLKHSKEKLEERIFEQMKKKEKKMLGIGTIMRKIKNKPTKSEQFLKSLESSGKSNETTLNNQFIDESDHYSPSTRTPTSGNYGKLTASPEHTSTPLLNAPPKAPRAGMPPKSTFSQKLRTNLSANKRLFKSETNVSAYYDGLNEIDPMRRFPSEQQNLWQEREYKTLSRFDDIREEPLSEHYNSEIDLHHCQPEFHSNSTNIRESLSSVDSSQVAGSPKSIESISKKSTDAASEKKFEESKAEEKDLCVPEVGKDADADSDTISDKSEKQQLSGNVHQPRDGATDQQNLATFRTSSNLTSSGSSDPAPFVDQTDSGKNHNDTDDDSNDDVEKNPFAHDDDDDDVKVVNKVSYPDYKAVRSLSLQINTKDHESEFKKTIIEVSRKLADINSSESVAATKERWNNEQDADIDRRHNWMKQNRAQSDWNIHSHTSNVKTSRFTKSSVNSAFIAARRKFSVEMAHLKEKVTLKDFKKSNVSSSASQNKGNSGNFETTQRDTTSAGSIPDFGNSSQLNHHVQPPSTYPTSPKTGKPFPYEPSGGEKIKSGKFKFFAPVKKLVSGKTGRKNKFEIQAEHASPKGASNSSQQSGELPQLTFYNLAERRPGNIVEKPLNVNDSSSGNSDKNKLEKMPETCDQSSNLMPKKKLAPSPPINVPQNGDHHITESTVISTTSSSWSSTNNAEAPVTPPPSVADKLSSSSSSSSSSSNSKSEENNDRSLTKKTCEPPYRESRVCI